MSTVIILMHLNVHYYFNFIVDHCVFLSCLEKFHTFQILQNAILYIAQPFNSSIELQFWRWDGWWHQFNGWTNGTANKQSHSTNIEMNTQIEKIKEESYWWKVNHWHSVLNSMCSSLFLHFVCITNDIHFISLDFTAVCYTILSYICV